MDADVEKFIKFCSSDFGKRVLERGAEYIRRELIGYQKILDVGSLTLFFTMPIGLRFIPFIIILISCFLYLFPYVVFLEYSTINLL